MRKYVCLENTDQLLSVRLLSDLPKMDDYHFIGITNEGVKFPCVLNKDNTGGYYIHTHGDEGLIDQLTGWRKLGDLN